MIGGERWKEWEYVEGRLVHDTRDLVWIMSV